MINQIRQPGRIWYGVGLALFVAGVSSFVWLLTSAVVGMGTGKQQVVVPGQAELTLERPGRYTIYHEYQTVIGDRVFLNSGPLPPLQVRIEAVKTGQLIPAAPGAMTESYTYGSRSGRSILSFSIEEPGSYTLTARYAEGAAGQDVVLAVGPSMGGGFILSMLAAIGSLFGGILAGGGLFAYTYWARHRKA